MENLSFKISRIIINFKYLGQCDAGMVIDKEINGTKWEPIYRYTSIYGTLIGDRYVIIEHCEYEGLFHKKCINNCLFIKWDKKGILPHTVHKESLPSRTKISIWKVKLRKF